MKLFSKAKTTILIVFFVSSIGLNVATVASAAVAGIMSNVFEAVTGLPSGRTKMVKSKHLKSQKAVRNISRKISKRTVKAAARNAGSVAAEAIPYLGVAAMLGVTAMDLYDACETMKDMRVLNKTFELEVSNAEDISTVCGKGVPNVKTVLSKIEGGTEQAWQDAVNLVPELSEFSDAILSALPGAETACAE